MTDVINAICNEGLSVPNLIGNFSGLVGCGEAAVEFDLRRESAAERLGRLGWC